MFNDPPELRTLINTPEFDEDLASIGVPLPRIDEALLAITFAMCKAPDRYPPLPGLAVRLAFVALPAEGAAPVRFKIYFDTTDDGSLILLGIERDDVE